MTLSKDTLPSLATLKSQFQGGALTKSDYIDAMYSRHSILFEYRDWLSGANIDRIEIARSGVTVTLRDPAITLACPKGDVRIAPIEVLNFGDFEAQELAWMRRIIRGIGAPEIAFYDIGANAGFYSIALSKEFPQLRATAFEPVPRTFSLLNENIRLNQSERITALNIGLSDEAGAATFHTYPSQSGASSLCENLTGIPTETVTCQLAVLDALMPPAKNRVDFVKCDVEGAELMALKGAHETLRVHRPVLFVEMLRKWSKNFGYHPNDIITYLGTLGYECYAVGNQALRKCRTVDENTAETNYLFFETTAHAALLHSLGIGATP